jgi:hypothetical protein
VKEVFEKAILTYGQTAQEDVAIVDEIADVSIMMEQLCMMYECFEAVENRRRYKVRRLENRLKEAPACSK